MIVLAIFDLPATLTASRNGDRLKLQVEGFLLKVRSL